MSTFKLPDLGEGLVEAEIVEWFVRVGEQIERDQPLVSVETDKAIVEIPSPQTGRIEELLGDAGDVMHVGDPLVVFGGDEARGQEQRTSAATPKQRDESSRESTTVVGEVRAGEEVITEKAAEVSRGVRATPAVRALARRLDVDLAAVTPTGPGDSISRNDVQRAAQTLADAGPLEPLRGVRRAMARTMTRAHSEVVPVTVSDDVDVECWAPGTDITLRLIRSIVAGCRAEPSLNAWYDGHAMGRRLLEKVDLGIAVDSEDGLFVPVLRDVGNRDAQDLRRGLDALVADVKARSIPGEEMRGYTITLSNFGTIAGRYSDPVVVPPTVAIVGAGKIRPQVVAVDGKPSVHRILPLSLSFDHRAVTGGEAARFLAAMMADLAEPS
ncbi:dihydrolipoamide acetyltransferase family protein [Nitrococcus mobilis]|uniref:Dihydrolipoamide acetyltransferase component of pyruvate dehydrogenase complex n=1 Tax=Nitrococcus mobilis Nb-231 TaxID=314278 RepID=A4BTC4_9GAMM|nr:dihydrolipoamide acetyltransferase family protein [Nitrococcus mobilis]EAR21026.1 dihydrolipoamide acetyltransferase [Nitrococcus mobilis Nb-231]